MPLKYSRKLQILKYFTKVNALQSYHPIQNLTPRKTISFGQPLKFHSTIGESFATQASNIEKETGTYKLLIANHLNTNQLNTQTPFLFFFLNPDKTDHQPFKKIYFR